jgi:hypothetical protein
VILVPLLIAFVFLNLYIVISGYYHVVLAQVADAGARTAINDRYWLGAEKPNFDSATTTDNVKAQVTSLWAKVGLPGSVDTTVDLSDPKTVTVKVAASGVAIPSGGFLPASLSLQATASEPYNIEMPYAVLGMSVHQAGVGGRGIYIPTYGAGAANLKYAPTCPGPTSYPNPGPDLSQPSTLPYFHVDVLSADSPPLAPITVQLDGIESPLSTAK